MRKPATSDNSTAVSLFPFLAVLLCTMGALLVLLVVLAQRAGHRAAIAKSAPAPQIDAPEPHDAAEVAALSAHLAKVRDYQRQLRHVRREAENRLSDEQQRLSHLEEHTRRLEHELARLSLAAQQLEATEQNQTVDREQAARELANLQSLIDETESQLDELRKQPTGKQSYAIVPYRGPNGTYRKPIYIECRQDGVVLHPEGVRLVASDFAVTSWAGNPLAAALRASREYLNAQAAKAGQEEPPDPYPLILVRPEGIRQYSLARAAIKAWDADFGYEFIDGDWKLEFPELADPQLARAQQHAILVARERLARLAQAAPRRFRGIGNGGGDGFGGATDSDRYGNGGTGSAATTSDELGTLSESDGGSSNAGNGSSESSGRNEGDSSLAASESDEGDFQYGGMSGGEGEASADGGQDANDGASTYASSEGGRNVGGSQPSAATGGGNSLRGSDSQAQDGQQPSANGAGSATCANGSPSAGRTSGSAGAQSSTAAGTPTAQLQNIAKSRGRNWAVERGGPGSVPIRRTIRAVVRNDQLALLPSRHATSGAEATGMVVSLEQSTTKVADQFVDALRRRVDEWGLAGNGLYWRPVLQLHVGPEAGPRASQLINMLRDSGVEIASPETALGGPRSATR